MAEQVTLNHWVRGSNPWRRTISATSPAARTKGSGRGPSPSSWVAPAGWNTDRVAKRKAGKETGTLRPPALLVAHRVTKEIEGTVLLAPVDLAVRPGECVVLRGGNGSGKTTLLRILAGTMDPSDGEATVDGTAADERTASVRRDVAALIGAPTAYRDLTLADHLVLVGATWGRGADGDEAAAAMLGTFEIGHLAERFPHELSSGQQQLFHLAMVLSRPARVLLLDEPEQRLDTHKRHLLGELLLERKAAGTALVVACHDPDLTQQIADRVLDVVPA
jgi:ABC-2 type transport system ATP-binding protein